MQKGVRRLLRQHLLKFFAPTHGASLRNFATSLILASLQGRIPSSGVKSPGGVPTSHVNLAALGLQGGRNGKIRTLVSSGGLDQAPAAIARVGCQRSRRVAD